MNTKQITVLLPRAPHTYTISIGQGLLPRFGEYVAIQKYSQIAIITDEEVGRQWLGQLQNGIGKEALIIRAPLGEEAKTIATAQRLWRRLLEGAFDRNGLIINLGGGAIGDLGGFVAATYKRGVDFAQAPTTLLAQVDAAVGGKVGINFGGIKNSIGAVQQPIEVVADVDALATLPPRALIASFAEVIKHGLIADEQYLKFVTSKPPAAFTPSELIEVIEGSCRIKASIVESDETEKGARRLLNFGHTIGHAIEALSLETGEPILHGEAVAIGMAAEARLSVALGLLENSTCENIERILQDAGLPIQLKYGNVDCILRALLNDKKSERGVIQWTLLQKIGKGIINQTPASDCVRIAIEYILNEHN